MKTPAYYIQEMDGGGWVLIRSHDDEPISVYGTEREARASLKEANQDRTDALREDAYAAKRERAREECAAELAGDRMRLERMNGERDNNWNRVKDNGI